MDEESNSYIESHLQACNPGVERYWARGDDSIEIAPETVFIRTASKISSWNTPWPINTQSSSWTRGEQWIWWWNTRAGADIVIDNSVIIHVDDVQDSLHVSRSQVHCVLVQVDEGVVCQEVIRKSWSGSSTRSPGCGGSSNIGLDSGVVTNISTDVSIVSVDVDDDEGRIQSQLSAGWNCSLKIKSLRDSS